MKILKVNTGPIATNTYVVIGENGQAFVIDPGGNPDKIQKLLDENNAAPVAVLLTHEHFDHCLAAAYFQKKGCKIYAHEQAKQNLIMGLHKSTRFRINVEDFDVDVALQDGQALDLCGLTLQVIHTPGHTSGSACFVLGDVIFSGDTLFCGSIGRTDLPTASYSQIIASIKNKLYTLQGDYRVLPGHEQETTLQQEKNTNRYTQ